MFSDIKLFIKKLESSINRRNCHVNIIFNLKDNFKIHFKDFNELALLTQIVASPFMGIDIQQLATCVMQNFGDDIAATEMEVIAFQNDLTLKSLVLNTKCIW